MARSTVHYANKETNNIFKKLHNKLRPAGTPVQRVKYIIELLLLRIFEVKLAQDSEYERLRAAFGGDNEALLFSSLSSLPNDQILVTLNSRFFPFYARILNEARKVWRGNLSIKMQDQLILIKEVFGNSNFTNNVISGNMAEIIGLVRSWTRTGCSKPICSVMPSSRRCPKPAAPRTCSFIFSALL